MNVKLKKAMAMLMIGALVFSTAACDFGNSSGTITVNKQESGDFSAKTYTSGEKFIFFADLPPLAIERDLEVYKEAGFTDYILIPWASYQAEYSKGNENPDSTQFASALRMLEEKGLGAYVRGFGTLDSLNLFENFDFSNYAAYRGFYVTDEPGGASFDSIAETVVPYWNEHYSQDGYWHLNLLPSYATNEQLGTESVDGKSSYEIYIDQYVEKILNNVQGEKGIGMDHYGLRIRGDQYYISDMYFYDLMILAQAAKRTNSTLHNCIQTSSGHTNTRVFTTAAELRWQYYVSMAFGSKIFEAFAYSDDSNLKFDCMVGKQLNDLYYYHQEVSAELKRFEDVFLAFDWDGVKSFVGTDNVLGYNAGFDAMKKDELSSLKNIKEIFATQDTLVGQFDCEGDNAYMLVNCSDPVDAKMDQITVKFENCKKVMVYRGGRLFKYIIPNNTLTLDLIGGEGVFVIPVVE